MKALENKIAPSIRMLTLQHPRVAAALRRVCRSIPPLRERQRTYFQLSAVKLKSRREQAEVDDLLKECKALEADLDKWIERTMKEARRSHLPKGGGGFAGELLVAVRYMRVQQIQYFEKQRVAKTERRRELRDLAKHAEKKVDELISVAEQPKQEALL